MKTLVHICCGPCALAAHAGLAGPGRQIIPFWYNPNIHPWSEHQRRLMAAGYLCQRLGLSLEKETEDFHRFIALLARAEETGNRCDACHRDRLSVTAEKARSLGIPSFSTTLLASTHQDRDRLVAAGNRAAAEHGLLFVSDDLRPFARETRREARRMSLYHQDYCGCLYSEWYRRLARE